MSVRIYRKIHILAVEEGSKIVYINNMEEYKKRLALTLAETGALFFGADLILKDGRPTPYFVNMGMFRTGRLAMEMGSYFAEMMIDRGLVDESD
ncbi:MAG: hypothetical protein ABII06_08780, partial [Pseudomonadota bacterium]